MIFFFFFFNDTATTEIYTLSLHDALPIYQRDAVGRGHGLIAHLQCGQLELGLDLVHDAPADVRSEEHTSELQSPDHLVCRLLLEKKKNNHESHAATICPCQTTPTAHHTSN